MSWRKWIVRGIAYGIIAVCAAAALLYQRWTNPGAVREQVIAKLHDIFPGAQVSVDSARLRLFGGIKLYGLRFSRRDDPDHIEFLHVPEAVFYHDKEKILDGELTLRKVELYGPRLRVQRRRDGSWNLQDLTKRPQPNLVIPTVVIHQGRVAYEDFADPVRPPVLEVEDIDLLLVNDPLPTVTARGSAKSETLGTLRLHGALQRPTNEVALNFQADQVPLTHQLILRFVGPTAALAGLELEARTNLGVELAYRPGLAQPLYYDVRACVSKGKLAHPQLPLPLHELSAALSCRNGEVRVEALHARSGAAEVALTGVGQLPRPDQNFEGRLDVKHLTLGKELSDRLPEKLQNVYKLFRPSGPAGLRIVCARRDGRWANLGDGSPARVSLRPENLSVSFIKFSYPVHRVSGSVDYHLLDRLVAVDVTGYAGQRPAFLKGTWRGEGPASVARFDLHAHDVAIDEKLLDALPDLHERLARSFHARGKLDVKAHIRHDPGVGFRNQYHVRAHDAELLWESFPYPLEKVSGVLDIYPDHWEFHEFQAEHDGGKVTVNGRSTPTTRPDGTKAHGLSVEIKGRNVPLDEQLHKALEPIANLHRAWQTFRPRGRLNFTASIDHPTGLPQDLDVRVDAQGCAVQPGFFPYLLHDLGGQFHYHRHRLELTKLRAWHGETLLALDEGTVDLHPGGGYYADFATVHAKGLRVSDDLIQALPKRLQEAAKAIKLQDPVNVKSRLIVSQAAEPGSPPDIYWEDTQVTLRNARLSAGVDLTGVTGTLACMGRHDGRQILGIQGNLLLEQATAFKQPFKNVQAHFQVRNTAPDVLLIEPLRAPLFGGDVAGVIRVDLNSTVRYEANLTASQIDLERFGRHNLGPKSEISGQAMARLHLTGQGTGLDSLEGNGSIDVPSGRLLNLPLLLDLLKFLGLHWPDRTMFEEAHALFSVHGRRVQVRRLDLLGNAFSLAGKGEFNLDGSDLRADLYTTTRAEQILPPVVRPFPPALSKNLLTIEMTGNLAGSSENGLKFQKHWVPLVTDPLLSLRDRLVGEAKLEKKN